MDIVMDIVYTLEELPSLASRFLEAFRGQRVFALHGEMGAGKTTFVNAFCKALGIGGHVSSPTFALVNEYRARGGERVYHMDWYRLKDGQEALRAGMEEYLYSGTTCLVEWPDRAPDLLPEGTVHVYLQVLDPLTRRLRV